MTQQLQEPQPKKQQTRRRRSWVLWTVVLIVLCAILAFTVTALLIVKSQGTAQGTTILTILSIVVGTSVALLSLLFAFLQWFHSRPSHSSGLLPPYTVLHHEEVTNDVGLSKSIPGDIHQEDWGEAPHIEQFYGRGQEQAELKQWVINDHCRMVAVLGIGGIGKTSLTAVVAEQMKDAFDSVFWRSLQNAPPLESILQSSIQFLSHQQQVDLPEDVDGQVTLLIQYLRERHCLVIFDNFETVLQAGDRVGQYREGYEGYSKLLQRVGEARHQSCLVLTSREKPKEVAFLEGDLSFVRSRELEGLKSIDGREILKDKGLRGEEKSWEALVLRYDGNPLALKIVAQFIREVFDGDVAGFLETGEAMFSTIRNVLEQQFGRLSALEQEIMYWLAIEREAVSLDELDEDLVHPISKRAMLEAIESLRRRSMIEISGVAHFTQQPVIIEYVIDELVRHVYEEIDTRTIELLASHALIKAQAKDYIRESQHRLILLPLLQRCLTTFGKEGLEQQFQSLLATLHTQHDHSPSYAAGNILNLLLQGGYALRGYDFSHLVVWQAYLQGVILSEVNFAHADLATSVFTNTFGGTVSMAFNPQGDLLAAGMLTGEIRFWHVVSGTPLHTIQGHPGWVYSVAFSPDGKTLASSYERTACLWEVSSGSCLHTLVGHTGRVQSVAFSPDGKTLASSGSYERTVRLWEVSSGQCLKTLLGHTDDVRSVAFSPDGKTLASSGSDDRTVRLWEVSSGQCKAVLEHSSWVFSVAFSPDGKTLASDDDRTVRLWEVSSGQCLKTLLGHTSWVSSVAFSPDEKTLASGSYDRTVRLWDVSSGSCLNTLVGHTEAVWRVAFSPDGKTLASSSGNDHALRLWEVSSGQCLKTLQGYVNRVWSVAFSPDGSILAGSYEDRTVRLWDVSSSSCLKTLQGPTQVVWSLAFSPDGKTLATGSHHDRTARLWEVSSGSCLHTLQGHTSVVHSVAFSPDGSILASGSGDQTVRLWEVSSGRCLKTLQDHAKQVWEVTFSPDGKTLASLSEDQTVRLWEVSSGQCKAVLEHSSLVGSMAFSPDGKIIAIASSSDDQKVGLWEVSSGSCLRTLRGPAIRGIRSLAFSPEGKIVASGRSEDGMLRVWEMSSGQFLAPILGHLRTIQSVVFSPDGKIVASGGYDGAITIWDLETGVCQQTLRSDRPYERMNITQAKGLTEAQKATLKALGAVEDPMEAHS